MRLMFSKMSYLELRFDPKSFLTLSFYCQREMTENVRDKGW